MRGDTRTAQDAEDDWLAPVAALADEQNVRTRHVLAQVDSRSRRQYVAGQCREATDERLIHQVEAVEGGDERTELRRRQRELPEPDCSPNQGIERVSVNSGACRFEWIGSDAW